jgi:hypothetical protein
MAAFLAGSLLTLLLPIALLIALVVWYWQFSRRVPETGDSAEPGGAAAAGTNPGPQVTEALPPDPQA